MPSPSPQGLSGARAWDPAPFLHRGTEVRPVQREKNDVTQAKPEPEADELKAEELEQATGGMKLRQTTRTAAADYQIFEAGFVRPGGG